MFQASCLKLRAALSRQIPASLLRIKGSKTCSHDKKCSFVHLSFGGTPQTAYLMPLQKPGSNIPCNQEPTLTQHKCAKKGKVPPNEKTKFLQFVQSNILRKNTRGPTLYCDLPLQIRLWSSPADADNALNVHGHKKWLTGAIDVCAPCVSHIMWNPVCHPLQYWRRNWGMMLWYSCSDISVR